MKSLDRLAKHYCIFCGKELTKEGRIQFNERGHVIGCCKDCYAYAELFVKEGRKTKTREE